MKWFLTIALGFVIAWIILRFAAPMAPKTSTYVQQPVIGRDLEDDDPQTMLMAVGLVHKPVKGPASAPINSMKPMPPPQPVRPMGPMGPPQPVRPMGPPNLTPSSV